MKKRIIPFVLTVLFTVGLVFILKTWGIKNADPPFPSADSFASKIEFESYEEKEKGTYLVCFNTVLTNLTDEEYKIWGGATLCKFHAEGIVLSADAVLKRHYLKPNEELKQEIYVSIPKDDFNGKECYITAEFDIEHKDSTKQYYKIKSDTLILNEDMLG